MNSFTVAALALIACGPALAQVTPSGGTDARGIPVVSSPATPPSGANTTVAVPPGGSVNVTPTQASVFTPTTAGGDVPPCSRTVTDRCAQTYEGQGFRAIGRHHARRKAIRHRK